MAKIKVVWTHFAKQQRDEIFDYWNRRNKSTSYSKKLKHLIRQRTNQLKIFPFTGKKMLTENVRILILKNYSLVYYIEKDTISIISFWENHHNPEKLDKILGL
ncbi:type II toxin-antitoxin system RelE/ParE family toxin [Chryseobacterium caseinilyticum]|uniref:Type II toxin-antitoxin system RelE/ParE family toxin n=1 Tax=Chryseobacterium caseinilyticum TaxID=2771428 RepID=A0ABR8Z7H5_9FLAO|nr:type II toxin-antitoxin system RelE/ParE family toxin [Chryseobacterium caseinilyticum]MBD8081162.1 type II toxin-antitoxin system RelE/ParE family toxin [Chryseobacterium caseinilyticum]